MEIGLLKPLLSTLLLPPMGPLLLALLGLLLAATQRRGALSLTALALLLLWVLSCHGTAVWLARTMLPQFAPLPVASLAARKAQAIVILGGGVLPLAPEYGAAQPGSSSASRLRYGLWLARQSRLPVAFSGGIGWGANEAQTESEAQVAARVALQDYGVTLRWLESESRDTAASARLLAPLLKRDGVERIALVTNAWHMPRSVAAFERAGLKVIPAPMGYVLTEQPGLLEWLPSADGLVASRQVLRESLGLGVAWLATRAYSVK